MKRFLILFFLCVGVAYGQNPIPGPLPSNLYTTAPSGSGSSGNVTAANPALAFNFSPSCSPTTTGCVNTFADTQQAVDCAWTGGTNTVTCNSAHFVSSDTGKLAFGYQTCNAFASTLISDAASGATVNSGGASTTMTFVSATSVTLSANATNSATVQTGQSGGGCFIWGHADDAGAATLSTQVAAAGACPKIFLTNAYYLFTTPPGFMVNQPAACNITGGSYGGTLGNLFYSYGFDLEGRGVGVTQIFIPPWFTGCTNGPESNACFVQPIESQWQDFSITGGGNSQGITSKTLVREVGPNTVNYVTFLNWGAGNATTICTKNTAWATWYQVNNSGCGYIGHDIANNLSSANWSGIRVAIENSPRALQVEAADPVGGTYTANCYDCHFFQSEFAPVSGSAELINLISGSVLLTRAFISVANNSAGISAIQTSASGARIVIKQSTFACGAGNATSGSVFLSSSGTFVSEDNVLCSGASGHPYFDSAGSLFIDQGNNKGLAGGAGTGIVGGYVADGHSVTGQCTGVGTAASTLALRISGTSVTGVGLPTTCTSVVLDAGFPVTASRTMALLVVSATAAGTNASSGVVTVLKNGGATTITCTIGTGTGCSDGTHTVAVVAGDLISIQFTTQVADTLAGVKAVVGWN